MTTGIEVEAVKVYVFFFNCNKYLLHYSYLCNFICGYYTTAHDVEKSVYVLSLPLAKIKIPMIFVLIVTNNLAFLPFAGRREGLMEREVEMVITSL